MTATAGLLLMNAVLPLIEGAIAKGAVKAIGSEDREELTADGCAIAARILDSAERKGKDLSPNSIAHYTLQSLKSGRRAGSAGPKGTHLYIHLRAPCAGRCQGGARHSTSQTGRHIIKAEQLPTMWQWGHTGNGDTQCMRQEPQWSLHSTKSSKLPGFQKEAEKRCSNSVSPCSPCSCPMAFVPDGLRPLHPPHCLNRS